MKKLNNKGFTIIELTLSFMFVFTLAFSMYQLLYNYRVKQSDESIISEMISFRDDVTLTIQTDITELTLKSIDYCTDSSGNVVSRCLILNFNDAGQTSKELKVVTDTIEYDGEDIEVNYISYDGVIFDEPDPILLEYKSGYMLYHTYSTDNLEDGNVTIYRIEIPIYHNDLDEDYGINIVAVGYDYNYDEDAVTTTYLSDKVLIDATGTSTVNLAETSIISKGTPNYSTTATTDEGLYAATDNYGTSYYFRGAVTNNYVYFAGYYWRIIRINGDGSIRLIYDGTSAYANGASSTNRYISTSKFNSSYNYNAFVGYMYGSTSATTYSGTHANTNSSTIKTTVDNWYKTNILNKNDSDGKSYSNYLSDTLFCNDRSTYNGTGIGNVTTYYSGYNRLVTNNSPILTCTNQNDRFTVSDTINGNGALTYPVGLITADEVVMAGGTRSSSNSSYYLYTGNSFWTMTPYGILNSSNPYGFNFYVYSNGSFSNVGQSTFISTALGVRPVINLSSTVLYSSGSGTASDPYKVKLK